MNFLDLAIKSVLAGTVGWTAICLLRRSSASARHVTLFLTLVGVSLLPLISFFVPRWYVPFLRLTDATAVAPLSVAPAEPIATQTVAGSALDPVTILFSVWIGVASLLCLRVFVNLFRLSRTERNLAMSIDPGLQALVAERCRESGRHVLLLEGLDHEPPMTWGHYRPVLVLPGDARSWPEDRLNSVVLHELAHIERGDWLASMFAQLACAVYWFNPFVWVIRKQMEIESETAADDRVLSMGVSATQYASHLVAVSKDLFVGRSATQVALAMARPGKLDRRIRAILESRRSRRSMRGSVTLGLAAMIVGVVGLLAAAAPTVVKEVSNKGPEVTLSSGVASSEDVTSDVEPDSKPTADDSTALESVNEDQSQGDIESPGQASAATGDERNVPQETPSEPAKSPSHPNVKPNTKPNPVVDAAAKAKPMPAPAPRPATKLEIKQADIPNSIHIDFDTADFKQEMKDASAEVESATRDAMKTVGDSPINNKAFIDGLRVFTKATTKLALESATKVTKVQLEAALKEAKKVQAQHQPPAVTHPH